MKKTNRKELRKILTFGLWMMIIILLGCDGNMAREKILAREKRSGLAFEFFQLDADSVVVGVTVQYSVGFDETSRQIYLFDRRRGLSYPSIFDSRKISEVLASEFRFPEPADSGK
jgi:hypothetical protein